MWKDDNKEGLNEQLVKIALSNDIELERVEQAIQHAEYRVKLEAKWKEMANNFYETLSDQEEAEEQNKEALARCGTSNVDI